MKPLVLVGSDDVDFYLFLDHILEVEGFVTKLADDVEETLRIATEQRPQAIVLDCQPSSLFALDACAQLKENPETSAMPIVAFISPGAEKRHADLLKLGVDENLTRPVAPAKLLDFLQDTLARQRPGPGIEPGSPSTGQLSYGNIDMNLDSYRVHHDGSEIHLSPIEFRLLRQLLQSPGRVFSRGELISAAWPENVFVEGRTVDVHIGRLRKMLMSGDKPNMIRTVRSAGYALTDWVDKKAVNDS